MSLLQVLLLLSCILRIQSIDKKQHEHKSLIDLLKAIKANHDEDRLHNRIQLNHKLYDKNDLIEYAIEYPKMNFSTNNYKKLDKSIVKITAIDLEEHVQAPNRRVESPSSSLNAIKTPGFNSAYTHEQTDILIKFNNELIFTNQIYKISICCNQEHNIVGYTLNINEKKYKAIALTSITKFTEIYFIENERNIKIKSNVITTPVVHLYNNNNKRSNDDDHGGGSIDDDNDNLYKLNSILITDIVTKDGGPWTNVVIEIHLCQTDCNNVDSKNIVMLNELESVNRIEANIKINSLDSETANELIMKLLEAVAINVFIKFSTILMAIISFLLVAFCFNLLLKAIVNYFVNVH